MLDTEAEVPWREPRPVEESWTETRPGGGSTVYKDNNVTEAEELTCYIFLVTENEECEEMWGKSSKWGYAYLQYDDCMNGAQAGFETCMCKAGGKDYCPGGKYDLYKIIIEAPDGLNAPDKFYDNGYTDDNFDLSQQAGNIKVDDQLAPAPSGESIGIESPKSSYTKDGVVK